MSKIRLDLDFADFKAIHLWAQRQDAPEARRLVEIMDRKCEAIVRREEYQDRRKSKK